MAKRKVASPTQQSADLTDTIAGFYDDPLGFVLFVFPWKQEGTRLHDQDGPDAWQIKVLTLIRNLIHAGFRKDAAARAGIQIAVASGHGIGKTALVAWIILWFISTRSHPQIVVTANTKTQLETKTWRELSKWWKMSIHGEWFEWTATKFYLKDAPETWFAAAIPWTKERAEAFAGTHEKHVLVIFDEASAIDDKIWEVTEGAMTTAGAMWIAFGNPTRNSGRFKQCWTKFRKQWYRLQVDSRTAKMADHRKIKQWEEAWGEDSDFFRIRVRGMFPHAAANQLIGEDLVMRAMKRDPQPEEYQAFPIVIGVDVARYGDDMTVILVRQGAKIHSITKYRELDTVQVAYRVIEHISEWTPDAVFVDSVGIGAGVVDTLRTAGHDPIEVNGAHEAIDKDTYYNRRAEMWGEMKFWLKDHDGALPSGDAFDQELFDDLTTPEYTFQKNRLLLESKEDMRDRGLSSPDTADALSVTFYMPVVRKHLAEDLVENMKKKMRAAAMAGSSWMAR